MAGNGSPRSPRCFLHRIFDSKSFFEKKKKTFFFVCISKFRPKVFWRISKKNPKYTELSKPKIALDYTPYKNILLKTPGCIHLFLGALLEQLAETVLHSPVAGLCNGLGQPVDNHLGASVGRGFPLHSIDSYRAGACQAGTWNSGCHTSK